MWCSRAMQEQLPRTEQSSARALETQATSHSCASVLRATSKYVRITYVITGLIAAERGCALAVRSLSQQLLRSFTERSSHWLTERTH